MDRTGVGRRLRENQPRLAAASADLVTLAGIALAGPVARRPSRVLLWSSVEKTSRARRNSNTEVTVTRVYSGADESGYFARVNTIGKDGVRPFVLVPGIGVASTYFERLAPNLNSFGPVHALDLPGFGGVPHPDSAMSIDQYADLLGKVIDDLGLDDPVLVGHSMGTQVVSALAARRPDLTTVVLIGPVVNPRERRVLRQGLRFAQASIREPGRVKLLAVSAYLLCGFRWFSRVLPEMMRFPIEDRLALIQADTLFIRGEFDAVVPREWLEHAGGLVPQSSTWEIPDAAHSVMHAHAEEVARLCVQHAEGTIERRAGLRQAAVVTERDTVAAAPTDVLGAIAGRVIETVGIVSNDDELIAKGKTTHAEAMEQPGDATEAPREE